MGYGKVYGGQQFQFQAAFTIYGSCQGAKSAKAGGRLSIIILPIFLLKKFIYDEKYI